MSISAAIHTASVADSDVSSLQPKQNHMLSKCSNPDCSASFLYLHSGKLFRLNRRKPAASSQDLEKKPARGIEFFWLCESCAAEFTLRADESSGVQVVSLPRRAMAAAASL